MTARPNFIFILADDLGYADLGCYGARIPSTPVLDGLATRGLRFLNGYSNSPVCSPTRFALLTGRYQYRYRGAAEEPISAQNQMVPLMAVPPEHPTLPSMMRDAGYRTAAQVTGCPPQMQLGLSTHAPEQAERALRAAPDYLAIGPVFPTGTKPGRPAVTLDYVRWAAAHVAIPWFAIGGINLDTLDAVLAAGARRVCVVSAILNAPDIAAACRKFRQRVEQHAL